MINNLKVMQNMPLSMKIILTKKRIEEFANEVGWEKVFVSFSGGKDSIVLLDIARQLFNFPAVFIDTGLEYPEIKDFVKTFDEITTIRPKMSFVEVLKKYGFPLISKEQAQYIRQYRTCKSEKTKHTRIHGNKWGRGKISKKWLFLLDAPFKISEQCCDVMKKRPIHKYIKENKQHVCQILSKTLKVYIAFV